ncbi:hypothetical protein [Flavobacterium gelatinilyticum]|uniref:hypothetical protein n=1 Tax=Flavobacterium gelatinilyticum TaxID=3003260 RepID=UPI00247FDB1D|nr:hypothetical protein [Flavobacterium gelatinilyticum]
MKYFASVLILLLIPLSQKTDKLNGRYNYLIENENVYIQKDKITFKDSVFIFDNKFMPKGKISYGNIILLENFINTDLIITISKDQIQKDTIEFYMHDKSGGGNYLDITSGKGRLIKIK